MEAIDDDRLRVYVVWGPMLEGDDEDLARQAAGHLSDPRAVHFWIGSTALAEAFREPLGLGPLPAWDAYLLFPPGARWTAPAPRPIYFVHQDGNQRLNGAELARQVRALLARSR